MLIEIETGGLSGIHLRNDNRAFLGIPYGQPPVGDLRWRPPNRALAWEGVRSASRFGPSSFQFPPPVTSLYFGGEHEFSEDCLYLNVYTGSKESGKRPVLVWFHFGAFQIGSASNPIYNGENLAADGVTVVTVNYRLGVLGFLAHKELSAESERQASGNYGVMDQIAALEWVQRNIEAFGGDPGNVTIGGVSAGGTSVHALRASPLANLLFCKAICESGPGIAPELDGNGHIAAFTTLSAAEEAGTELLDLLGSSSIDELRKLPAEKIASVQLPRTNGPWEGNVFPGSVSVSMFDTKYPIVDGHVLPESPWTALLSGKTADVPLLAGNAGNEGSGLMQIRSLSKYLTFVHENFSKHAEEALRVYPASSDAEAWTSSAQLLADQTFTYPVWTTARLQAKKLKSPAWYYQFLREPPIPKDSEIAEKDYAGAFHGAGTLYMFGNLDAWEWDWTDEDRVLSQKMMEATVEFLKRGRLTLNVEAGPDVNLLKGVSEIMIWDENCTAGMKEVPDRLKQVSAFWDRCYGLEDL
ncbi:alpha/beta-hydrolase [Bimuria novae-zelandiae CBS 107.79]|uniref:Carboxylic ester hydrolase n=1 Tax=Bimuria novae-zelandiae CBS 107.79 TaxID=1447943 RepID=A0A6A5UU54_9PLEO|nr:alpha/beta-hydrolase [Bimuria novae-zelandiae CBS 107.79]